MKTSTTTTTTITTTDQMKQCVASTQGIASSTSASNGSEQQGEATTNALLDDCGSDLNKSCPSSDQIAILKGINQQQDYPITHSKVFIGRDPVNCQVCLGNDSSVSFIHAQLEFLEFNHDEKKPKICLVRDLSSKNGVYVNSVRLKKGSSSIVKSGDELRFGHQVFKLEIVEKEVSGTVQDQDVNSTSTKTTNSPSLCKENTMFETDFEVSDCVSFSTKDDFPLTHDVYTHSLIDEEIRQHGKFKEQLFDRIIQLSYELSNKVKLLTTCSDSPYERNNTPFAVLSPLNDLQECIDNALSETVFERRKDVESKELKIYANNLEKKLIHYKKEATNNENRFKQQKKLNQQIQNEMERVVQELTSSLHSCQDERYSLKKRISKDKDKHECMKNEMDILKYKLTCAEQELHQLRKSNAMLRDHLLKGQEYSDCLHQDMIQELSNQVQKTINQTRDIHKSNSLDVFKGTQEECEYSELLNHGPLNQTINGTGIVEQHYHHSM
nr:unnamed protein product [Naegleria fowleri]